MIFDGQTLKALKSINSIPGFEPASSAGLTSVGDAYAAASYGYRCIHLRANAISQIPYRISSLGRQGRQPQRPGYIQVVQDWSHSDHLPRLLWLTEAALCLYGAAYWFRERNLVKSLGYRWLAPQTIQPIYNKEQGITGYKRDLNVRARRSFASSLNREEMLDSGVPLIGVQPDFDLEDVVAFFFPDPETEIGPGRSPTHVALEAIGLLKYQNEFASGFFQRGAIPAVMLSVKGPAQEAELKRLENWWKRLLRGAAKAWETVAVRADVEPKIIGQPVKDLGMPELSKSVRGQIAVAYGVPETILEDAANFATARTHRKSFYVETIIPEANLVQAELNRQVFRPEGLRFEFLPEQLQVMQEEEAERSLALSQLVSAGVPLLVAMNILGFYVDASVLDDLAISIAAAVDPAERERVQVQIQQARIRLEEGRLELLRESLSREERAA
ncbi:MAG: phage portal protein [bacterium]